MQRFRTLPPMSIPGTILLILLPSAITAGTPSPEAAELYIISPADGATVTSPVTVRFGLRGMGVSPAGTAQPNTGHHHLLLDTPLPSLTQPIPSDAHHYHFGGGQTESTLELTPGTHRLQLLLGDHWHIPHDPPLYSEPITIDVQEPTH